MKEVGRALVEEKKERMKEERNKRKNEGLMEEKRKECYKENEETKSIDRNGVIGEKEESMEGTVGR